MLVWIGVALLGGVGAVLRVVVGDRVGRAPYGTFVVNVTGSFALGVLAGVAVRGDSRLLWGTALLGSYTTFSTWMFETRRLGERGERVAAALNVVLSLAVGVGAVALGRAIGS